MGEYLPLFRGEEGSVSFSTTTAVTGGQPVEVGTADWSVAPAAAASVKVVGIAGHDAAVGDKVAVEVGRPIHEIVASGAIARGAKIEAAGSGKGRTATTGMAFGLALATVADGALVPYIQL